MDSAALKLARAREHYDALKRDIARFNTLKGNRVVIDGDPRRPARPIPIRLKIRTEPPLERWGVLVGDCVHNARSALDHLVWELTGQGIDISDTQSAFPIYDDAKNFRGGVNRRLGKIDRSRYHRQIALIRWWQPFRRREPYRTALQVLNVLDIADKHKVISLAAVLPADLEILINIGQTTTVHKPAIQASPVPPPYENGSVIAWYSDGGVTTTQGDPEISIDARVSVQVLFSDGVPGAYHNWDVIENLETLLTQVEMIVSRFSSLRITPATPQPPKRRVTGKFRFGASMTFTPTPQSVTNP